MTTRINQLDFLKCICILLMVMFHLVFIETKFPYAKQIVYTFHMPVFLLISGYLVHANRPAKRFFTSQLWIFIPYVIMEIPYVVMSGFLGVRGADTDLSVQNLLYRIFVNPMGPYWYLQTMLVCNITLWCVQRVLRNFGWLARVIVYSAVLTALVIGTGIIKPNVFYYFVGLVIAESGVGFMKVFRPSMIALLFGGLLCFYPDNLHYFTLGGMAITFFAVTFMLWVYDHCHEKVLKPMLFVGRNTLSVFLFSPVFTAAARPVAPFFSFDPTGMLFLVFATTMAVAGSLAIAWCMDRLKLSRWFCGKTDMLAR